MKLFFLFVSVIVMEEKSMKIGCENAVNKGERLKERERETRLTTTRKKKLL